MSRPFEISFDFELAPSGLIIPLRATAELHHSDPYYVVSNIHLNGHRRSSNDHPVIPQFEIKKINRDGEQVWVHCDSEKESLLSMAAGKGIEGAGSGREV